MGVEVERGAREWSEGDDGGSPCKRPLLDGAAHDPSGRQVEIVQQSGRRTLGVSHPTVRPGAVLIPQNRRV